jgi:hypothetical protein
MQASKVRGGHNSCLCLLELVPPPPFFFFFCRICVRSYICVLILLCMCPNTIMYVSSYYFVWPLTTIYVSSYYYMCVRIRLYVCLHTTVCVSSYYYMCVLILLYVCPHTTICVSSACARRELVAATRTSDSFYYYECPHTTIRGSYRKFVLIPLYVCPQPAPDRSFLPLRELPTAFTTMCPHTTIRGSYTINVSSYRYMCVLILQYMCPQPAPDGIPNENFRKLLVSLSKHDKFAYIHAQTNLGTAIYVSCYVQYMCPAMYTTSSPTSTYCYICVLPCTCPHTTIFILLYMCPYTAVYISTRASSWPTSVVYGQTYSSV